MRLPDPAIIMMEVGINQALKLDDFSFNKVRGLKGKIIGFELQGIDLCFYLAPNDDGIQVLPALSSNATADTWIRGTPLSMLKTAVSEDRSGLFKGDVIIDGDMTLGQDFQRMLNGLEIDWEEPLSKIVGDVAAHQLGDLVRGLSSWAIQSMDSLTKTTGEYYQEETQDIVNPVEIERFVDNVDLLRSDTDRLTLKLKKLEEKIKVS